MEDVKSLKKHTSNRKKIILDIGLCIFQNIPSVFMCMFLIYVSVFVQCNCKCMYKCDNKHKY